MSEKRSIPTALGIIIGPATAYLSYLIFKTGIPELAQLLCLASFMLAGHDIAKGGLSLAGGLFTLFAPALPIALYLQQTPAISEHILSPANLAVAWVISALIGALLAGRHPCTHTHHLSRLAVLSSALVGLILLFIWLS